MKKLHPNAVKLFFWKTFISLFLIGGFVLFMLVCLLAGAITGGEDATPLLFLIFALFVLPLPILFLFPWWLAKLIYDNFRYELQNDRLYIESGIIWKRSVVIPYERVQNIDIVRGPLERMLNLSILMVQTAGVSGVALVEGRIPGILLEEANILRDQIISKMKRPKDQGV